MAATDTLGLIGQTIDDKYVVESCVGEGGFGVVYRAMHKLWQKPVAIKCFKTLMDASPAMRERLLRDFIQEGALLTELSARTASIVQARDVGTLTTRAGQWVPYMVLEWLEGQTLEEWQDAHPGQRWSLERAIAILEPVAVALDVAHARNVAHRDIKPANIFLLAETIAAMHAPELDHDHVVVKLLDFGIAKVVQSAADHGFTKTQGALTSFTPAFGAPEQFSRSVGSTGPWTDVYSLALILSELLSGRVALDGEDFIQLGMASSDPGRRPTPRALGADHGDAVEAVMLRALAVRPADRFQRAGELWNALRMATGHAPLRTATTDPRASSGTPIASVRGPVPAAMVVANGVTAAPSSTFSPNVSGPPPAKKPPYARIGVAVLAFLALGGGAAFLVTRGLDKRGTASQASSSPAAASTAASPTASAGAKPSIAGEAPRCPPSMAEIPGGQFFMGTDDPKADEDEKPAHNVKLSPYCIDRTEVTVADYKRCSDDGACKRAATEVWWPEMTPAEKKTFSPLCNVADPAGKANHPINCVDWDMATTYCAAQGKRLPTEAEWEFAARGPDGRIYPWGDERPDAHHLNACGAECTAWLKAHGQPGAAMYPGDDGYANTAPVGSFPAGASRYGLLDVVGNVWEWASDFTGPYGAGAQVDPIGPSNGKERVVRGGAWNGSFPAWVRPSQRYSFTPDTKSFAVGFRCAKALR